MFQPRVEHRAQDRELLFDLPVSIHQRDGVVVVLEPAHKAVGDPLGTVAIGKEILVRLEDRDMPFAYPKPQEKQPDKPKQDEGTRYDRGEDDDEE